MTPHPREAPVIVIGGGISGLACAEALLRSGREVLVLEQGEAAGGCIETLREGGYVFELGANAVAGQSAAFREVVTDLDLTPALLESREEARPRYLYFQGHLHPLPQTLRDFLHTDLFTRRQKLRVLLEPLVPVRPSESEASVAEFFGRRIGRSATSIWVDVVVSSTFAGNPNRLGIRSAFPHLLRMEQEDGGIVRGMRARARKRRRDLEAGKPHPRSLSLRGGLRGLVEAFQTRLGDRLRLRCEAHSLHEAEDGRLLVEAQDAVGVTEHLPASAVVLATPPRATGRLLQQLVPDAADLLWEVETVDLVVVGAGFDREHLPGLREAYGFLIPRSQRMRTLGWIFHSCNFAEHAPEGKVAMMGVLGGSLDPKAVSLSDEQIRHVMLGELALCLHQVRLPVPEVFSIRRWQQVLPQYNVGHERRVRAVRMLAEMRAPRLRLIGGWVDGMSLDACLASARSAAQELDVALSG